MKKTPLPKAKVTLTFETNKWNHNLHRAIVDGRSLADIQYYEPLPGQPGLHRYHLYTEARRGGLIDEGFFETRAIAERHANWRANL